MPLSPGPTRFKIVKCDSCKFQTGEMADTDYPYPGVRCIKGHWEGLGEPEAEFDMWKDCKDFVKE